MRLVLLVAISLLTAQGYASKVQLIDSRENTYLRAPETDGGQSVSTGLSAVLSALLGVIPPDSTIRPEGAQQLASILKPTLKKPQAHPAITVPGLPISELAEVFPGRTSLQIQFEAHDRHAADALVSSHAQVSAANPDVRITSLDQSLLNECEGRCAHHVHAMAAAIFGAGQQGSRLMLADGSTLDLEQLGGPMLSMELASLHAGITQFVQRYQRGDANAKEVHVLVMTFLGLQDVQARHGLGSPEALASKAAVKQALRWAVEQLDAALKGDVTYQVAAADALPSLNREDLGQWKEQARRMLEGVPLSVNAGEGKPWYGDDEAAQSKRFTAKAAAYGSFILLVYGILGATVCLCDMRAKRDTMLFGTKKTD